MARTGDSDELDTEPVGPDDDGEEPKDEEPKTAVEAIK